MAFTAAELSNIANGVLDFNFKGQPFLQSIQNKPLLKALTARQKTFPGGKENITIPVKGDYTSDIQGFSHNDTVTYPNPANIKRASYPWRQVHCGIQCTLTELIIDGISVVDSLNSKSTVEHSERELVSLTNLLQDKTEDMMEGRMRGFNEMLWQDGTQDSKEVPGIRSMITTTPTTGVVGGLDRGTFDWWRNRVSLGIVPSPSLQTLTKVLRAEARQLTRYGGKPSLPLAGSAFLEALDLEVAEKGTYTQQGFTKGGATETGMNEITMRGIGTFMYDPTLDTLGLSKYCYILDEKNIQLMPIDNEDWKQHNPARPADQYVLYRAVTWAGGLVGRQFNGCGVYTIA